MTRPAGVLLAGCSLAALLGACDSGGGGGGESADPDCDVIEVDEVEDALGGSAEELNSEIEGLCNISVEDSDAGADGTVGIVTLDDESVFDEDCSSAETLDGIGDEACYLEDFTAATVLVGNEAFRVEANFAGADDEEALRDGVIGVAEAVATGFDGQDRFDSR